MAASNGSLFRVIAGNSPVTGEFPSKELWCRLCCFFSVGTHNVIKTVEWQMIWDYMPFMWRQRNGLEKRMENGCNEKYQFAYQKIKMDLPTRDIFHTICWCLPGNHPSLGQIELHSGSNGVGFHYIWVWNKNCNIRFCETWPTWNHRASIL